MKKLAGLVLVATALILPFKAQAVLFDFDSATQYGGFPMSLTVGGVTANFSASGQGYSIQSCGVMGFTPQGFSGLSLYPNSVYLADLMVSYSVPLTGFSIMYAPEEYGCDSSARMRVTTYMDGAYVGTATTTAPVPGTWPTGVLSISSSQPFNSVEVHYDAPPPTGGDWGPIFMADNMIVTPASPSAVGGEAKPAAATTLVAPNPFVGQTSIRFSLARSGPATVAIYDVQGRLVRTLASFAVLESGTRNAAWDGRNDRGQRSDAGVYFCRISTRDQTSTSRIVFLGGK